jgi:hypothetical protein
LPQETETERKLLAWLERNAPWLMKLDSTKVMWRVGLELDHGRLIRRSIDESLLVAASVLRQEYEDGPTKISSEEEEQANAGRTTAGATPGATTGRPGTRGPGTGGSSALN